MVIGLLLAGGRSRRMGGGDKFLRDLAGRRLIDRAIARLRPQVEELLLSANGNAGSLASCGLPIVEDGPAAGRGPLAGILAGLSWAAARHGETALLVSMPADTPFFPRDLVAQLVSARAQAGAEIAFAVSSGGRHHAAAAWPAALAPALALWLAGDSGSAIRDFVATRRAVAVPFAAAYDPFHNVNTPDDLERAGVIERQASP